MNFLPLADGDARFALFLQTLDEPELIDSETLFEMLERLYHSGAQQPRQRFDELVDALRAKAPEIYQQYTAYIVSWQLDNALTAGTTASALSPLVHELAATAENKSDEYPLMLDKLADHGQTDALLELIEHGWPIIKASTELFPWTIDDFAQQMATYTSINVVEHDPSGSHNRDQAIQRCTLRLAIDCTADADDDNADERHSYNAWLEVYRALIDDGAQRPW